MSWSFKVISPSGLGFVGGGDGERLCCLDGLGEADLGFWVWIFFFVDLPANMKCMSWNAINGQGFKLFDKGQKLD